MTTVMLHHSVSKVAEDSCSKLTSEDSDRACRPQVSGPWNQDRDGIPSIPIAESQNKTMPDAHQTTNATIIAGFGKLFTGDIGTKN